MQKIKEKKLFIFDMDGLLVESGKISYTAYLQVAKEYDFEMIEDVYYILTGKTETKIRNEMRKLYGDDAPIDLWRDRINHIKKDVFKNIKFDHIKKGAEEILKFAKENHIKTVLATSNTIEKVRLFLEPNNLIKYFDFIITGNDVSNGKPSPEIFLKSCEVANVDPNEAIIFEDSIAGIKAANNANIESVWIKDSLDGMGKVSGKYEIKADISTCFNNLPSSTFLFNDLIEAKQKLMKIYNLNSDV